MGKEARKRTKSGVPITDDLVERLAKEAEDGYDVNEIISRRRGRPSIGAGPAVIESVRLDPELKQALSRRAVADSEAASSVIRKALRRYLGTTEASPDR